MPGITREVAAAFLRLMTAFPDARRDAKLTVAVYGDGLADFPEAAQLRAIDRAIRETKFFPSVAELREFAESARFHRVDDRRSSQDQPPFILWSTEGVGLKREGETLEDAVWRNHVRRFASKNNPRAWWAETRGPRPGEPGCLAPPAILREFGFEPQRDDRS